MTTSGSYDFIVVGGGTSGSVLASRLANSPAAPLVLIIEAGDDNRAEDLRSIDLRFFATSSPGLDWGYQSLPNTAQNGKIHTYFRGKGLGGSSATNYGFWTVGHRDNFNSWAEKVGDDAWKWDGEGGVKARLRKIERVHVAEEHPYHKDFWDPKAISEHSTHGNLDISYFKVPEKNSLEEISFQAAKETGMPINGDVNSGDCTGFGIAPSTMSDHLRATAASAYLYPKPENLTIITNAISTKILFEGEKAVGVETADGKSFYASKDVVLSAGSIDTVKLLLLSGIGPAADLSNLSISLVKDIPCVGKHLLDHAGLSISVMLKPDAAYNKDQARMQQLAMGFFNYKEIINTKEFAELDSTAQRDLLRTPNYEIFTSNIPFTPGDHIPNDTDRYISAGLVLISPQSHGTVTLASSDPSVAPRIDTNFFSHPFDRRMAIEAYKKLWKFVHAPAFASRIQTVLASPPADTASDEKIFAHVSAHTTPIMHASGTCKMGKIGEEGTVVDTQFRVVGIEGLRVADLSVSPIITASHTQSTAYIVGETAAEKLIAEYGLAN